MNLSSVKRNLRSSTHYFGATALVWFVFLHSTACAKSLSNEFILLFALLIAGLSLLMLRELGYFKTLRLHPRKSDVLFVLCVVPLSAVCAHALFGLLFGLEGSTAQEMLIWAPPLACFIFAAEYISSGVLLENERRKKVVLDLMPLELENLLEDFTAWGLDSYIEFLSRNDLRKYLLEAREKEISLIIISRDAVSSFEADGILVRAHLAGIPVVDHQTVSSDLTGRIRLKDADQWSYILDATRQTPLLRGFSQAKILLEPLIAVGLGFLLLPLMLALAALIKLSSKGPVLYKQVRTGYLGRSFHLIKFRSMCANAEAGGPQWCSKNDSRVTVIGRIMRRSRLDELPQLWNVVRGEMSFFGPRPERPEMYMRLKKEIPLFPMRTVVRPGITGWAQVCAGYASSVEESRRKLEYDMYYIKHMSPRLDAVILIKTLLVVLRDSSRHSGALELVHILEKARQVDKPLEELSKSQSGNTAAAVKSTAKLSSQTV